MKSQRNERALASVVGGFAASFAMDVVQNGWAAVFERRRAEDQRDEEVDGIASVVRFIGRFVPALRSDHDSALAARAVHYVFGIGFAAAYVYGVERAAWLSTSGGVVFGSALFVLSDRVLIPALKLGRSWSRYTYSERGNAYFSHVTYGVVLELARGRFVEGTPRPRHRSREERRSPGYEPLMHNEDVERATDRGDDLREAIVSADDTGLVSQQGILTVAELGDSPAADESRQ